MAKVISRRRRSFRNPLPDGELRIATSSLPASCEGWLTSASLCCNEAVLSSERASKRLRNVRKQTGTSRSSHAVRAILVVAGRSRAVWCVREGSTERSAQ
jgi:hypothetical protein